MPSATKSLFIGVEIGGTKLQMLAADSSLNIQRRWRASVDRAAGAPAIRRRLAEGLREISAGQTPTAVGIGFGGPIDWRTGRIDRSHQIEGWTGFDLAGSFRELSGARVVVENDANAASLGEALSGAGVGQSPVFFITLGSGVGGGLVVDGEIYHGAPPGEAEFGHIRLDRSGATVESRCSGWAIDARIRALRTTRPQSILASLLPEEPGGEARHLPAALARNDPAAVEILAELSGDLAFALSHVAHLFHPRVIILGGGLANLGEVLRQSVADRLPPLLMRAFLPGPTIALPRLGEDAVPIGALHLALAASSLSPRGRGPG